MNPEFLESDELDYEMAIRKVYLDTRRKKTSALVKFLSDEKDGLLTAPSSSVLDPEEEIVTCGVKLDLLKLSIEVVSHKDESELNRCVTRLIHIQNRAQRIVPSVISGRMHETLLNGIREADVQLRVIYNRKTQSKRKTVQSHIVPNTTSAHIETPDQEVNLMYASNSNPVDFISGDTGVINNQSSGCKAADAFTCFDPISVNSSNVAGLPPPILPVTPPFRNLPSNVDTDINKRFERLEKMMEQLIVQSGSQRNPLRENSGDSRSLGAIPKTNNNPPRSNVPTWSLPTESTQRDLYQNPYPQNNQSRFNQNNLFSSENQGFGIPVQNQNRTRQQTPYYSNEQTTCDPRCSQYTHQTPLVNSSFMNDILIF